MQNFNQWITCPQPKSQAKLRLYCLPFAGGGASIYHSWGKLLGSDIEVCPIQLPARENRYSETAYKNVELLAGVLAEKLKMHSHKPFAIYGHSMGALLAFELTRELQRNLAQMPQHLILGAHRAAHLPRNRRELYRLPDSLFIEELSKLGGFPAEVLSSSELMQFLMPTLKSDFELCETYQFKESEPLNCTIHCLAGKHDIEASPAVMSQWNIHTAAETFSHVFDAGHFFIKSHQNELLKKIQMILSKY
jgi:surfactin synthase thioesterase subunit